MIKREHLLRSKEFWLVKIQNELFNELEIYMERHHLNRTQFAKKLGVSKSYISQILNGNFDHKLSKLIELSIAIDKIPFFRYEDIEKCILLDSFDRLSIIEEKNMDVHVSIDYSSSQLFEEINSNQIKYNNLIERDSFVYSYS